MSAPHEPLRQVVVEDKEEHSAAEALSAGSASGEEAKDTDPSVQPPARKKKWTRRFNPLRWQDPPPVPRERIVSREYGASVFSKMYFQWMSPLMKVSKKELI